MRIAVVVHQFFPEHIYGTEVLTLHFARQLRELGHTVLVVCGCPSRRTDDRNGRVEAYAFEGTAVRRLVRAGDPRAGPRIRRQWSAPELDPCFGRLLDEFEPDVVHFFHLQNLSASMLGIAAQRAPMFFTATDFWLACPLTLMRLTDGSECEGPSSSHVNCIKHYAEVSRGSVGRLARKVPLKVFSVALQLAALPGANRLARVREARALQQRTQVLRESIGSAARVFVPTAFLAAALERVGVPQSKIVTTMYGIELRYFDECGPAFAHTPAVRFGFIGSMSEHKGAHVLIDAFQRLPREVPATLTILGASPDTEYTNRLRALSGADQRISFRPSFPPDRIGQVLGEIDCLVIPSLWPENAPLVALSARAAKRAVIASDVPGLSEAAPHARVFREGDAAGLACELQAVLEEPELIARQARDAPKPKSVAQMVDEILHHYRIELRERS